ncbi:hypothetical protein [Gardnerella vaginalis]|uniref:Lipoprotein n=1 Tax=Gardnerella vaginalis TaxID=2702 RepID=A0A133NPZ3_GARVA|nr:hypothetical protein [Gardnerella vaginalis]KXA18336.1 hypothetical protein HMPREF3216_00624 [Gardnerella vaginalis]
MRGKKYFLTAAMLIATTLIFSACSGSRQFNNTAVHSAKNNNACYKVLQSAKTNQKIVDKKGKTATSKDLQNAAHSWKNVATQCNSRFAQGVVFSAQNTWKLVNLRQSAESSANAIKIANQMESNVYKKLYDFSNNTKDLHLYWNHDPLAKAALEQDKLAFMLQTLAAKDVDNVSLRQSDITATIANTLMHFASNGKDLRQKVYEIPQKNLDSGVAKDEASEKDLPIVAIAYMDCARGELDALNQVIFPADKNGNVDHNQIFSKTNQDFIDILADIAISHIISAYSYGYPSDSSTIFEQ